MKVLNIDGAKVKVVYPEEVDSYLTPEDKEMDLRVREAAAAAIRKKEFFEALNKKEINLIF